MYVKAINHRWEYGVGRFKNPGFKPGIIIFSLWGIVLHTTSFKVAGAGGRGVVERNSTGNLGLVLQNHEFSGTLPVELN